MGHEQKSAKIFDSYLLPHIIEESHNIYAFCNFEIKFCNSRKDLRYLYMLLVILKMMQGYRKF